MVVLSDDAAVLTAAKQAEDGRGLILRLFEPTGTPRTTVVSLPWLGMEQRVALAPFEIRTYKVDGAEHVWQEVNLIEEPI